MNDNNYWYNLKEDNGNVYIEKKEKESSYFNSNLNNQINNYQPSNNNTKKKNWKKAFVILSVLVIVPLLAMLFINMFTVEKQGYKHRTFMIYMVGSDLESDGSMATYDLNDIVGNKVDLDNNNVILLVGGSKKWHNFVNENEIGMYELTDIGFKKIKSYEITSMGEADTLSSFLKYTHNVYPSEKYDLIFWNHGLGAAGIEVDEVSSDYLDIYEMKKVFENSPFSKEKMEVVIFNNCMASNLHFASVMKDYAEYMVASEEVMYVGAIIDRLNFINDVEKDDNGYDVGKLYVDKSDESIEKINNAKNTKLDSTLSIIDLSKIDEVEKNVDEFFSSIDLNDYRLVSRARRKTKTYGAGDYIYDTVDLYTFSESLSDLASASSKLALQDSINDAVVYNSSANDYSNGISIYFPYFGSTEYVEVHLYNFGRLWNNGYMTFINEYVKMVTSAKRANRAGKDEVLTLTNDVKLLDNQIEVELTSDEINNYQNANIYIFDKKENGKYQLLLKSDQVLLDNNKLVFNEPKILKTSNNLAISSILENDTYKVYGKKDESDIIIDVENVNGYGEINKVLLDSKDKPIGGYMDFNDENITFDSIIYNIDDNKLNEEWYLNTEKETIDNKNNEISVVVDDLKDYYVIIEMFDVNNDVYYTKLTKM